ncbi:MAG: rhodanese-like domain-containing protein [Dehalococcoidia bacterium]|nr:MAG: rhodanese-like domain-containing protein [Dehalococcoidia bacterium]
MKVLLLKTALIGLIGTIVIINACSGNSVTTGIPTPPSPEELANQGFLLPELPRVTGEQLKKWIDDNEPLVVVDTRIEFMFNQGHLPESIDIPVILDTEQMTNELLALPKDKKIIFYCD